MMILLDEKNFKKEISTSKGLIIVDFYADWCNPCRMLKPVFEELSKDPGLQNIRFGTVDTEKSPEIAESNNVQGIPCMIIYKDGKEHNRIVGFSTKDALRKKILAVVR